jgi:branched-chain amino acid transport system substrate-binding protein
MQKKLPLAFIVILLLINVFSLPGFLQTKGENSDSRVIKIGLVEPLSTSVGLDMDRAAKLAVEEINNAGGIYVSEWDTKVPINIDIVNTVDDSPLNSVLPVTQAIASDQVDLLIGGYSSSGTLANEVVAIQNRVPFIITSASNQLVTRRGPQGNYGGLPVGDSLRIEDAEGMSYIFHYGSTMYQTSKSVVHFIAESMKPTVAPDRHIRLAFLFRNDAFGIGVEQASKFWIQNDLLPINVVAEVSSPTVTTNFQTDLTVIKGNNPDVVFVVNNPDITPLIIKQGLNDVGLKVPYIASENNEDSIFYTLLGNYGDKQFLDSSFAPFAGPPYYSKEVATYVQNYEQKSYTYGAIPRTYGANVYDAFYIAKDAIERAGTINKAAVRQAIEETNIPQILTMTQTGKIRFSTGLDYHEISPIIFIEQLFWNTATSELSPSIVWPQLPVSALLQVPYQGQGYSGWCALTSLAMVLRYYGFNFHGWDYAHDYRLATNQGVKVDDFEKFVKQNYNLQTEKRIYNPISKNQIFEDIKSDISNGYPVLIQLSPFLSFEGHTVVAVGYDKTGLYINDPSGALFISYLGMPWSAISSFNQAYISWAELDDFVVTWPLTSTLTIKGTPNYAARSGTMYIDGAIDIDFYNPQSGPYAQCTELYLNRGLNWQRTTNGISTIDPVIGPNSNSLRAGIHVSNSKSLPEDLTLTFKILGSDGKVCFDDSKTKYIGPFNQYQFLWVIDDVRSLSFPAGPTTIYFSLINSKGQIVDSFVTPPFYLTGQSIQMTEQQKHLYLHVYDSQANHVGLNYITNQTELEIPGAFYFDDTNGTITIGLSQTEQMKIIVDAAYAEDPIEMYNVTISAKTNQGVTTQTYSNDIASGGIKIISDIPKPSSTPTPTPTSPPTPFASPTPSPSLISTSSPTSTPATPSPTSPPNPTQHQSPTPKPISTSSPIATPTSTQSPTSLPSSQANSTSGSQSSKESPMFLYAIIAATVFAAIGGTILMLKRKR